MSKRPATKRAATKRPRKAKPAAKSTALVRVVRAELVPANYPRQAGELTIAEDPSIGQLGLVELKLTKREEEVLARPVDPALVRTRPMKGGRVVPYLPHHVYTRWLNEAIGRTRWSLVPLAKPKASGGTIQVPYMLHIHGAPVAFAWGEAEFFDNNDQQSVGDVVESTVAIALRRCMKRLGIGLELWDPAWLEQHGYREREGEKPRQRQERQQEYRRDDRVISQGTKTKPGQLERLWAIIRNSGRNDEVIREWLHKEYGYTSTRDIKRSDYEAICDAIQASGPLPARSRVPGEEG